MSERSDPGGRPGYGSGRICNNYADFHSRKAGSVPDPDRKVLEYRSGSGKMADPTAPNPDSVRFRIRTLVVSLYTILWKCVGTVTSRSISM